MPELPARTEGVTVTATGRVAVVPDVLVLTVGAKATERDVSRALSTASEAMAAMVARLREGGLTDRDLRTSGVSLWSRTDDRGRVTGHTATQQLHATLRDPAAAGTLVPAVVDAGGAAAELDGLRFELDDDTAALTAARDDAWERARAIAGQHAARAGRSLGAVLRVVEATGGAPPVPMVAASSITRASASMPVERGEHEVAVTIEVEWAFTA